MASAKEEFFVPPVVFHNEKDEAVLYVAPVHPSQVLAIPPVVEAPKKKCGKLARCCGFFFTLVAGFMLVKGLIFSHMVYTGLRAVAFQASVGGIAIFFSTLACCCARGRGWNKMRCARTVVVLLTTAALIGVHFGIMHLPQGTFRPMQETITQPAGSVFFTPIKAPYMCQRPHVEFSSVSNAEFTYEPMTGAIYGSMPAEGAVLTCTASCNRWSTVDCGTITLVAGETPVMPDGVSSEEMPRGSWFARRHGDREGRHHGDGERNWSQEREGHRRHHNRPQPEQPEQQPEQSEVLPVPVPPTSWPAPVYPPPAGSTVVEEPVVVVPEPLVPEQNDTPVDTVTPVDTDEEDVEQPEQPEQPEQEDNDADDNEEEEEELPERPRHRPGHWGHHGFGGRWNGRQGAPRCINSMLWAVWGVLAIVTMITSVAQRRTMAAQQSSRIDSGFVFAFFLQALGFVVLSFGSYIRALSTVGLLAMMVVARAMKHGSGCN